ncbi:MAG: CPBP family intramembrane metalloprotease [Acidimicrobiia bacterium]|nr:CPBP family intramembrane metalloprotease [Acidimicrobiia bacterium]
MSEPIPHQAGRYRWPIIVAGLSVALLAYSAVGLSPIWYVPVNVLVAALLLVAGARLGLTRSELGLCRDRIRAGLRLGGLVGLGAAGVLAVGAALPVTRPLFDDARTAGIGFGLLAYRGLVRIPLGTALLEEVAFRGVLFAGWRRISSSMVAAFGSSVVFGLWHVRPAIDLLVENDVAADGWPRLAAVGGALAGTALAGLGFCWLRLRSGSLLAPFVAHAAINSLATVAAFIA